MMKLKFRLRRFLDLFQLPAPVLRSFLASWITFEQAQILKGTSEIYSMKYVLEFLYRLEKANWREKAKSRFKKECRKLKGERQ